MSEPKYTDPTVAYNTGYNDGQREERDALLKALAAFEVSTLCDEKLHCSGLPMVMGRFARFRRELERGVHCEGTIDRLIQTELASRPTGDVFTCRYCGKRVDFMKPYHSDERGL